MVNFPTSLDSFTNPIGGVDRQNSVTVPHATQHSNLNDAVEALEAKVGANSSADVNSIDYKLLQKMDANGTFSVNTLKLSASPTVGSPIVGELYMNTAENGLPEVKINSSSSLTIGAEFYVNVVNKTGSTLADGTVVYVQSAQGNRPTAVSAQANAAATSRVIGVVTDNIADNAEGFVTVLGNVHGYNTSGFSAGDTLYLSATTPGALTNVAPSSPNYVVVVGKALNSTVNGIVHCRPEMALSNNNSLGTDILAPTQASVKSYVDTGLSGKAATGAVGSTGITMSTANLLGRSTAGTGAIEEITLGTNLSFSGTTLNASGGSSTDYSCRLRKSTGQSIGTTRTALTFDTEDFDTDSMHDNVTNNTRITFTHAGKYMVGGLITTDGNAYAGGSIRVDGTTEIARAVAGNAASSVANGAFVQTPYNFTAGQYVELMGVFGSTQTSTSGVDGCNFWAYKIP